MFEIVIVDKPSFFSVEIGDTATGYLLEWRHARRLQRKDGGVTVLAVAGVQVEVEVAQRLLGIRVVDAVLHFKNW